MTACTVEGCNRKHQARGWCLMHYDNMEDMRSKGRHWATKLSHCTNGHLRFAGSAYSSGSCKACARVRWRAKQSGRSFGQELACSV